MRNQPSVSDPIAEELRLIRQNVPGVRGSITATSDGLLVAHDMHGLEPTQVAALVAATHAVAVRASLSTECGQLKEVITRGADGYLAVYAAGGPVIVAVLGTSELNVAMLNFQARRMIDRIAEHTPGLPGARGRTPPCPPRAGRMTGPRATSRCPPSPCSSPARLVAGLRRA